MSKRDPRVKPVSVYLSEGEKQTISVMAENAKRTVSDYLRTLFLEDVENTPGRLE